MINKIFVIIFLVIFSFTEAIDDRDIYTVVSADGHSTNNINEEIQLAKFDNQELVQVKLYYESLCPYCKDFGTKHFKSVVQALYPFLDVAIYPYGNAKTTIVNGKPVIKCQHGPEECYGNKLHACAIDHLKNMTEAVLYNACMMDPSKDRLGSNDKRAIECGESMNIDSKPITTCAKDDKGLELLYKIGQDSSKVGFTFVPYPLINGKLYDREHNLDTDEAYMKAVCAAFKNPPPPCKNA